MKYPRLDQSAFETEYARLMRDIRVARRRMFYWLTCFVVWLAFMLYLIVAGIPFGLGWRMMPIELCVLVGQYVGAWAIGRYTR